MKKRGGLTLVEFSITTDAHGRVTIKDEWSDENWRSAKMLTIVEMLDRIEALAGKTPKRWPEDEMLVLCKRIRGWRTGDLNVDAAIRAAYWLGMLAAHANIGMQKSRIGRLPADDPAAPRGRPRGQKVQPESVKRRLRRARTRR